MHVPLHALDDLIMRVAQHTQQVQLTLCGAASHSMPKLHCQLWHNQLQSKEQRSCYCCRFLVVVTSLKASSTPDPLKAWPQRGTISMHGRS